MALMTEIPVYLEAYSKDDLIKMMLKNNQTDGKQYQYMCPVKDGDKWVTWFYKNIVLNLNVQSIKPVIEKKQTKKKSK